MAVAARLRRRLGQPASELSLPLSAQGAIGTSGDRGGSPYVKSYPRFERRPLLTASQRCGVAGNIWWIVELTFFPAPGD